MGILLSLWLLRGIFGNHHDYEKPKTNCPSFVTDKIYIYKHNYNLRLTDEKGKEYVLNSDKPVFKNGTATSTLLGVNVKIESVEEKTDENAVEYNKKVVECLKKEKIISN